MIKYADRGLVSRGLNLQLYNKLFWLSSGIFLLLYHAILLAMNLQEEDFIQKTITGSLCSNPSKPVVCLSKYFTENSKNIVLRVSFVGFNMGYSLILYFLVTTSRNILRNNSNRVKAQIGIFRRNIWTLKETIVQMIVVSLMELTRIELIYYALNNQEKGADFRKTIYIINVVLNLLVNDILIGVILPCKVVYNMFEEMPVSKSPIDSFYARPRAPIPRRDVEIEMARPRQETPRKTNYFSYLPQVDI